MIVKKVTLHLIEQNLLSPFVTSMGSVNERESIIVEVEDNEGVIGWGEVVAFSTPWYTEETIKTTWHILEDYLIPALFQNALHHPASFQSISQSIKRNNMAKAGLETALWDLYAKKQNLSLANVIGGTKKKIDSGVVVSIDSIDQVLRKIEFHLEEGYKRIKIKIKPGQDNKLLSQIRKEFPTVPLMADANSAYTLDDLARLKSLDEYKLMMIEQPLGADDIVDHAILQQEINTPICLDESIVSLEDARKAITLGSCRIINIKIGRVGGLSEAIKIHDLCKENNVPVWCGGMLETGISRAHNIALASLANFTIPGDISASSRYWEKDIIDPEVVVEKGTIKVPEGPGIGFEVNLEHLRKVTKLSKIFCP